MPVITEFRKITKGLGQQLHKTRSG